MESENVFPPRREDVAEDGQRNVVLRLHGMLELRAGLVRDAEEELRRKAVLVGIGLEEFTAIDRIALQFLTHTW